VWWIWVLKHKEPTSLGESKTTNMDSTADSAEQCVKNPTKQTGEVVKHESSTASFSNLSDHALPDDQSLPYFGTDTIPTWVYRRRGGHIVPKMADVADCAERSDFQPHTHTLALKFLT
jgi:hypothetical protein